MFARVTRLQGQVDRLDQGIRIFQEQTLPVVQAQSGFTGAYLLVDRQQGTALAISMWDSEGAMQQSEHDIAEQRTQAAQQMGAGEPTVEHYEVVVLEGPGLGSAARVTTGETPTGRLDDAIRLYQEQIVPSLKQTPGLVGLRLLVNRQRGTSIAIGLWESEEAMRQSEATAQAQRDRAVQQGGSSVTAVDRYAVAVQV